MTFGWEQASTPVTQTIASLMVKSFVDSGYNLIDTARIYSGGKNECMVDEACKGLDVLVGTKAHPSQSGGLSPAGLQGQYSTSSSDLANCLPFNEYYLHQPDTESDLIDSLIFVDRLVKEGKVKKLGLSNYNVDEVKRAFELCDTHKLTPPTVYQGLYNPLNRMVEAELLPFLKEKGCSFVGYNGLAAGLLTGKHTSLTDVKEGRFKNNPNYLPRFYTPASFQALEKIREACAEADLTMVEATYIWLLRHSALDAENGDGILLGASSMSQLDSNLQAVEKAKSTELSEQLLKAFNDAWSVTKYESPFRYWRGYSSDMPQRASRDQGEGYVVKKS